MYTKFKWIINYICSVFLLSMSLITFLIPKTTYYVVGSVLFVIGLLSVIPTTKVNNGIVLSLHIVEIISELSIGALLISFGKKDKDIGNWFGYIFGCLLYYRGSIFIICNTIEKKKDNVMIVLIHILFISIGTIIFFYRGFTIDNLSKVISAIGIICCLLLIIEGNTNYKKYRIKRVIQRELVDKKII